MVLLASMCCVAVAAESQSAYPLWDGRETVEEYAKRNGLEPAQTLDLGNGVKLELVLIPAGKFIMGTPEFLDPPERPEIGRAILVLGCGLAGALLLILIIRAIRRRRWPQFSLGFLLVLVFAAAIAVWGGVREWQSRVAWREHIDTRKRAFLGHHVQDLRFSTREDLDETAHEVTISRPFYLGRYEVTQAQYAQVVGDEPTRHIPIHAGHPVLGPDRPVVAMYWRDTQEFCRKVEERLGGRIRLPTEAEWEFACRAGSRTNYCAGDTEEDLARVAWYAGNSLALARAQGKKSFPFPIGTKAPNAFGLYDMHGNVSEWCHDFYGDYPLQPVTDPAGPTEGNHFKDAHVARGGSCDSGPTFCRSARRFMDIRWHYVGWIGFRIVLDVDRNR